MKDTVDAVQDPIPADIQAMSTEGLNAAMWEIGPSITNGSEGSFGMKQWTRWIFIQRELVKRRGWALMPPEERRELAKELGDWVLH